MSGSTFEFDAKIWIYPGPAAWHFITIPRLQSKTICGLFKPFHRGWNSLRVSVEVGKSRWQTSIFYDRKQGGYLLPIKSAIRTKEKLLAGKKIAVRIAVLIHQP
jgi:hypothetical protein